MNAGISFALPRSFGQLVQANAAQILGERAAELAVASRAMEQQLALPGVADSLNELAAQLVLMHDEFEGHFTLAIETGPAVETPIDDDVPVSRPLS